MHIQDSAKAFEAFLRERGLTPTALASIQEIGRAWLDFYRDVRIDDGAKEEGANADMLLFECGYREALAGYYEACYYVHLARQFVSAEGEDDDAMFQLVWHAEYEPTEELVALGRDLEWCDTPSAYAYFSNRVLSSPAFSAVAAKAPAKIKYYFTGV
jgi:hypothetical protein